MSFSLWLLVLGCILLTLGLASAYLRLLPVSTSFLYLLFGLAIGPAGLHAWRSGLADISGWFEHLAEAALLISLFIGGLKLRLPLRSPAWTAAWLLAGPVLLGCILGLTLGAHFLFGLDWGLALLVAAILAPVVRALVRRSYRGLEHVPPEGPALVCVNHIGAFDPLCFALALWDNDTPALFLGKAGIVRAPVVGPILRSAGIVPVDRETSRADEAFGAAVTLLRRGRVIGQRAAAGGGRAGGAGRGGPVGQGHAPRLRGRRQRPGWSGGERGAREALYHPCNNAANDWVTQATHALFAAFAPGARARTR